MYFTNDPEGDLPSYTYTDTLEPNVALPLIKILVIYLLDESYPAI